MKKYYQTDELQKMIDWENILKMSRYAGGHDDQMIGLFKGSILIAHWNEGDYQGSVATCVLLPDGRYVIYNDYYGSCSGCDAWEGANDEEVRRMCIDLSNGAYIFENISDIVEFLKGEKDRYSWNGSCSSGLLVEILKNISVLRDIKMTSIVEK